MTIHGGNNGCNHLWLQEQFSGKLEDLWSCMVGSLKQLLPGASVAKYCKVLQ